MTRLVEVVITAFLQLAGWVDSRVEGVTTWCCSEYR